MEGAVPPHGERLSPVQLIKEMIRMQAETTRILVSAASKHGATGEIADRIGSVLQGRGHAVDILAPDLVEDLSGYHAIVLGSAAYAGRWLPGAIELAKRISDDVEAVPTWLFSSGPLGDPPKPEEDPVDVAEIHEKLAARHHQVFSGKIDKSQLSFGERAIIVAVRAPVGDFRNWEEIESWAERIADALTTERSTS
jgi:menaquinone-dependent protoporphyrinogen oxidase